MTKKTEKERKKFDPDVAAQILADAKVLGSDKAAGEKWGVTQRTIGRYRRRMMSGNDPALSAEVLRLHKDVLHGWGEQRLKALNMAMERIQELIPSCTEISVLATFSEKVGGLDMVLNAFPSPDSESPRPHTEGSLAPAPEGGDGENEGEDTD